MTAVQNAIETECRRINLHYSGISQIAYMDKGFGKYTLVSADCLADEIRAAADEQLKLVEVPARDETEIRRKVRASKCAGKLYDAGILVGDGEEVQICVQWKHEDHKSYFRHSSNYAQKRSHTNTQRTDQSVANTDSFDKMNIDTHGLACCNLVQAINAGVNMEFTTKCEKRNHVLTLFKTNDSMYALTEIRAFNTHGRSIRLDVAIYARGDDSHLFCVEILNKHRTEKGNREGLQWCEIVASRVIDAFRNYDEKNNGTIVIPTEPRDDIQRHCLDCEKMDQEQLTQQIIDTNSDESSDEEDDLPLSKRKAVENALPPSVFDTNGKYNFTFPPPPRNFAFTH